MSSQSQELPLFAICLLVPPRVFRWRDWRCGTHCTAQHACRQGEPGTSQLFAIRYLVDHRCLSFILWIFHTHSTQKRVYGNNLRRPTGIVLPHFSQQPKVPFSIRSKAALTSSMNCFSKVLVARSGRGTGVRLCRTCNCR
jgi:hypothetical protein